MSSAARMWTWYQGVKHSHLLVVVPLPSGPGLAGASPLSSLQQLLSSTPALNNVCVFGGGRLNHILAPPLQRRQQGPETQFPLRLLLPRCPFTTQGSLHPKSFHQVTGGYSSGPFWTLPEMTWKELTLPWSPEHTGWSEPCLTEAAAGETARGLHVELKDWSQHSRGARTLEDALCSSHFSPYLLADRGEGSRFLSEE